jgi:hypothetical protein
MQGKLRWAVAAFFVVGGAVACSRAPHGGQAEEAAMAADAGESGSAPAAAAPAAGGGVDDSQLSSAAVTQGDGQRAFIRSASADFEVQDVYKTALAIEDEVAALGGYVVENDIRSEVSETRRRALGQQRQLTLTRYRTVGELTVRVPTDKTQMFLRSLARQMTFLQRRNFQARDAQLEILRARLAQQRAQQTQTAIASAGEEGRTRDRVLAAQAQGQAQLEHDSALLAQREYEELVSFSTLRLSFQQQPQVRTSEGVDTEAVMRDRGPGFFRRLSSSLQSGWNGVLEVVLVLVAMWPLWLAVLASIWGLRAWRRSSARRAAKDAA